MKRAVLFGTFTYISEKNIYAGRSQEDKIRKTISFFSGKAF